MGSEKIIIFGGNGAIGKRMVKCFAKKYMNVVVIDVCPTEKNEVERNVKEYQVDLSDSLKMMDLQEKLKNNKYHGIYLAGMLSNEIDNVSLKMNYLSNVSALVNVIGILREVIEHFTFVSSVSVYGQQRKVPITEDAPLMPMTIYGAFKSAGDHCSRILCDRLNIPITIFRLTQLFGIESAKDALPHVLIERARNGYSLKYDGNSRTCRDYLHVEDYINIMQRHVEKPVEGVFNLGSGNPVRLMDMFAAITKRFNVGFNFDEEKANQANENSQYLDIQKINSQYEFKPKINIMNWLQSVDPLDPFNDSNQTSEQE